MSDQNILTQALTNTAISRRAFLKWSAVLGGTAALAGGGLDLGLKLAEASPASAAPNSNGIYYTSCYHNCGGRCIVRAEVKDGVVVRVLPDPDPVDTFDRPRVIPCVRGRARKRMLYAAERLKYPMKRAGKRGEGKFTRITWDEALNTIADQMKRIKAKYGNEAFLYQYASGQIAGGIDQTYSGSGPICRLMNLFGGFTKIYGSYSSACYSAVLPYITGGGGNSNDDMVNAKLVVLFSDNPLVNRSGGMGGGYHCLKAKEAGAKFITVDPRLTDSAIALEADWVPIYPVQMSPSLRRWRTSWSRKTCTTRISWPSTRSALTKAPCRQARRPRVLGWRTSWVMPMVKPRRPSGRLRLRASPPTASSSWHVKWQLPSPVR